MRVVVVEDEYYLRKSLVKMLEEMNLGIIVCYEAETGKQAVEYLEGESADLVITDINMPEMDGLELARYISCYRPGTEVIIESGYADFEYARKAIRYGVKNYLTKPIRAEELAVALKALQQQKRDFFQYLNMPLITTSPVLLKQLELQCGGWFGKLAYRLFLFQSNGKGQPATALNIRNQIRRKFTSGQIYDLCFQGQEECLVIVFDEKVPLQKKEAAVQLKPLLSAYGISCGYSRIFSQLEDVRSAYRDCIYAINHRLLLADQYLFEYSEEIQIQQLLSVNEELLLYESILKGSYHQARAIVSRFFSRCREGADVYSLYSGVMQIFSSVSKAFSRREEGGRPLNEGHYLYFSFKADLYQFKTLAGLQAYIESILKNICGSGDGAASNTIITELKDYVARNYRYEISLKELARHRYFMNPSYLSRLFKAETGMNFSKYLIRYRMERAGELLRDTLFRINEIADCVGYNDTSHFIRTFREYYHLTPEQYRQLEENR